MNKQDIIDIIENSDYEHGDFYIAHAPAVLNFRFDQLEFADEYVTISYGGTELNIAYYAVFAVGMREPDDDVDAYAEI